MISTLTQIQRIIYYIVRSSGSVFAEESIIGDELRNEPALLASDVEMFVSRLQDIVFSVAGGVAIAMIVYGSVILVTAGGNEERVGKGKKILTFAFGGLLLIFLAYFLVRLFVLTLGGTVS